MKGRETSYETVTIVSEGLNQSLVLGKERRKYFGRYLEYAAAAKLLQSCPTLCDPRDNSPPGSPIPGVLQARTLEWVAISFPNAEK